MTLEEEYKNKREEYFKNRVLRKIDETPIEFQKRMFDEYNKLQSQNPNLKRIFDSVEYCVPEDIEDFKNSRLYKWIKYELLRFNAICFSKNINKRIDLKISVDNISFIVEDDNSSEDLYHTLNY